MGYTFPRVSRHALLVKRGISGLGLFAADFIKRGDFVIEYYGKVVTDEEADKKGGKYLFKVERGKTIDGTTRKNVARYINHSCKPNCKAEMDGSRVFISARRAIQPGEEITYDYGKEYWEDHIGPKRCGCASCRSNKR